MTNHAAPTRWDFSSGFPMDYLIVLVNDTHVYRKGV